MYCSATPRPRSTSLLFSSSTQESHLVVVAHLLKQAPFPLIIHGNIVLWKPLTLIACTRGQNHSKQEALWIHRVRARPFLTASQNSWPETEGEIGRGPPARRRGAQRDRRQVRSVDYSGGNLGDGRTHEDTAKSVIILYLQQYVEHGATIVL